jgi:hypothetical protein
MEDGHVAQDGIRFRPRKMNPGESAAYIPYPVTAIVTEIFTVENDQNRDGETVLLDLHCAMLGIDLFKVPWVGMGKGSLDNYVHYNPVSVNKNVDKSSFNNQQINPKLMENDTVLVLFANANVHQPYAIAVLPHTQTEEKSPSPRPRLADGDIYKVRFNGTNMLIDKDGNVRFENTNTYDPKVTRNKKFVIDFNAKKDDDSRETQQVMVEVDNSAGGVLRITTTKSDGKSQTFTMDAAANSTEIKCEHSAGTNSIKLSPSGADIEVTGGDATVNASGNATVQAGGKATVQAGGDVDVTAGGNVVVQGTQIQLNGSSGQVLTTVTDPVIDLITGAPTTGVPTVLAG